MDRRTAYAPPVRNFWLPQLAVLSSSVPRPLRRWSFAPAYLLIAFSLWIVYGFGSNIYKLYCLGPSSLYPSSSSPTVNLVLAATKEQDYSWATRLTITNLQIYPYIADNPNATYHPRQNKGREAMIILTYLHDFYDKLPDISIFTHADDVAWHNDVVMKNSLTWTLSNLDLDEVIRRQYLSLRINWENACPAWINMSMTADSPQYSELKREEPLMAAAFQQNFPGASIPEIMAGPCCSQFAVTREAIQRVPKSDYAKFIHWLLATEIEDDLSGRIWEHWWQYIFLHKAVDCPIEYKALCRGFHVCFEHQLAFVDFNVKARLKESKEWERNSVRDAQVVDRQKLHLLDWEIRDLEEEMEKRRAEAVETGRTEERRMEIAGDF